MRTIRGLLGLTMKAYLSRPFGVLSQRDQAMPHALSAHPFTEGFHDLDLAWVVLLGAGAFVIVSAA